MYEYVLVKLNLIAILVSTERVTPSVSIPPSGAGSLPPLLSS